MELCMHALTSDEAFLQHMIVHHQFAIDMAQQIQRKTLHPAMLEYLRDMVRQQGYEITMMRSVMTRGLPERFALDKPDPGHEPSKFQYYGVVGSGPGCVPMTGHNPANDVEFLKHMIPHHQIAVDLSRVMMTKTKNQHIMALCYDIIRQQEHEIAKMRNLLEFIGGWMWPSNCF